MLKKIFLANVLYLLLGFVYYYFRNRIPIESTSAILLRFYYISLFMATFSLFYLYFVISESHKKVTKYLMLVTLTLLIVHNFLWTAGLTLMSDYNSFVDTKVSYPDVNNKWYKILEQYLDEGEGAFGSYSRTVEVYEIFPGFRHVKKL